MSVRSGARRRAAEQPTRPALELARQLEALCQESPAIDYDDPAAEAAYYAKAHKVIDAIIALPAHTVSELRLKAAAYAWCTGGAPAATPATPATRSERVLASLLRDLQAL
jgi:hypothetical protein